MPARMATNKYGKTVAYISFTCSRAEAQRLVYLLETLKPVFKRHGGRLRGVQGPATGFMDPKLGDLAEMRLVAFPSLEQAEATLADTDYAATEELRGSFNRLDVALLK